MRDRLIKLIKNAKKAFPKDRPVLDIEEFVADFLLANGAIVPPKKAYQTDGIRVYESDVKEVVFDCGSFAFCSSAIGRRVFLTREEAEQAMKGGAQE